MSHDRKNSLYFGAYYCLRLTTRLQVQRRVGTHALDQCSRRRVVRERARTREHVDGGARHELRASAAGLCAGNIKIKETCANKPFEVREDR
jgi:hypothetical protein